jgi:putative hydrolase of the HAD superfamily
MPIRAIYFDIGGVLVRTVDRSPRSQLAARLGLTYETLSELVFGGESGRRAQRGEISAEAQWAYVCQQVSWPLANWQDLRQAFFAGDQLDVELLEAVHSLHACYRTGIISNALSEARPLIEDRWGMTEVFDAIILSCEVGLMKPDARIYQRALQALDVQPGEAVFVDDFMHNVEGARAVGMHAIHFHNPKQTLQELEQLLR